MLLHWWKYKRNLSPYLDRSLPAANFRDLWRHLHHCDDCNEELAQLEGMSAHLRSIPTPAMPPDLAFNIRMKLSHQRYVSEQPSWKWKLANRLGSFAGPALAGVACALLFFGSFVFHFSAPRDSSPDVPLVLRTPARLVATGPLELETRTENLVVQVLVDQNGRVADYDIIAGTYTDQDVRDLRNRLLFTVFDPARVIGKLGAPQAMPETLLLSFSSVRVRG